MYFVRLLQALLPGLLVFALLQPLAVAQQAESAAKPPALMVGPWNLDELHKTPDVRWVNTKGLVRSLYYEGGPYRGKSTRVFAHFGVPEGVGEGEKLPAMVLVHGGGGTAFPEWAEIWAKRGYLCIAMDLAGRGPKRKPLPDGGPDQSHKQKFDDIKNGVQDAWTYHAVANVVRAVSALRAHPNVAPSKIGITGISWGGYLTSIVCGVDNRLSAAVPVYGCGFLHENSVWLKDFQRLGEQDAKLWVENFDPSHYLGNCHMPTLWMNGTNDFAYPLDSYKKSYSLVRGPRTLCITVRMPHGHPPGWARPEIGLFIDSVFREGAPLATVSKMKRVGNSLSATFQSRSPVKKAFLHYALAAGPWPKRLWKTVPAELADKTTATADIAAVFEESRPYVCYLTLVDQRGAVVSTEHEIVQR